MSKLRDESLNQDAYGTIYQGKTLIKRWRRGTIRPGCIAFFIIGH